MFFPRTVEQRLRKLCEAFPAVVMTGARQAGKTTLLREAFPEHHYVSLDLPTTAEQAERNPDLFLRRHPAPMLIDEIQYATGLFRHLKSAIDERRHDMGRFLLTGSQHFSLMREVSDSLAGRCGVVELENLSLQEIEAKTPIADTPSELAALLTRGQFPELWRVPELPAREFYSAYVATYLERDVRQILNVGNLRTFERFVRLLATRSARQLNKSDLARDAGISVNAVTSWLSVLQTSGQISLLEPWYVNFGKRLAKAPRVFFRDSGLLCFLLNLDRDTVLTTPLLGAVWETFVFAEMRKLSEAGGANPGSLWTYRDLSRREIDFVIERAGTLSFVECKWQEQPHGRDAGTIRKVSAELEAAGGPWSPGPHFVVGRPASSYDLDAGVTAVGVRDLPAVVAGTPLS